MQFVEIAGVMGSGKTALTHAFNDLGFAPIVEKETDLQRMFFVEPYLTDPKRYGFEGAINFIAFHFNRIQEGLHKKPDDARVVVDTSLLLQYAYHHTLLNPGELAAVSTVIEHAYKKLPPVALRVVTDTPPEVLAARIRDTEGGVPLPYLQDAVSGLEKAMTLFNGNTPLLRLDGTQHDWAHNPVHREQVKLRIASALANQ